MTVGRAYFLIGGLRVLIVEEHQLFDDDAYLSDDYNPLVIGDDGTIELKGDDDGGSDDDGLPLRMWDDRRPE